MKLKFSYTPKKDANGYFLLLPNGETKRFKTIKGFERWFTSASNELNGVFKILLLLYPNFTEFYSEIYIRSNVLNTNRLVYVQKLNDNSIIITRIFGVIPRRGFYEAYTDMYRLLSLYGEMLSGYEAEFIVFSDRFVLNKIRMIREQLQIQKDKLNEL